MKKFFILTLAIAIVGCSHTKKVKSTPFRPIASDTSLEKYSYLLYGTKKLSNGHKIIAQGTCFFLKFSDKLYLITAKHVLTGCDNSSNKNQNYPDTLNICIRDNVGMTIAYYPISIVEYKATLPCLPILADPDIYAFLITDKIQNNINAIDTSFLRMPDRINQTAIFGFPPRLTPDQLPVLMDSFNNSSFIFKDKKQLVGGEVDTMYYHLYVKDVIFNDTLHGFSGSPVFIKGPYSDKWSVVGMLTGFDKYDSLFFIPRLGYIKPYLR